MNTDSFEIERKFLIKYPSSDIIDRCFDVTEITQIYLTGGEEGFTERIRKRGNNGRYIYTHTRKMHISNIRRIELENEISESEYNELMCRADPERKVIEKKRCCLNWLGQIFEIDLFPFWSDKAVMEIELKDEEQLVQFPEGIDIIREVTDDRRYTNSAMAVEIPSDD